MTDQQPQQTNKKNVVLLHLKAIGEAPALKNSKFKIDGEKLVADVEKFLQKQLKYDGALVSNIGYLVEYCCPHYPLSMLYCI